MFYFENDVLKSDFLAGVEHYFTTRKITPLLNENRIFAEAVPSRSGQVCKPGAAVEQMNFTWNEYSSFESKSKISADTPDNPKPGWVSPQQTHSDHVEFVDERTEYPDTDGLIITKPNQKICLKFADCTPLIFYNPKTNIGAISHAGWRGTAQKIGIKTVQKMCGGLNINQSNMELQNHIIKGAEDIIAIIGPAIGLCCYEVSEDVKTKLLETVNETMGLYNNRNVDLKAINARQLQEIGVEKIDICPYCTSCNNDLFYSYRKENGTKDRHYAVLTLPSLS